MHAESSGPVVVLGASPKPERYSNQAVVALLRHGYEVIPVHPAVSEIEGLDAVSSLDAISVQVDTVTVYVGPDRSAQMLDALCGLSPRRVIFNPGAENKQLASALEASGIDVEEACTLVLLASGQF